MYTSVCVQCRHVVPSQSLLFALNRSQSERANPTAASCSKSNKTLNQREREQWRQEQEQEQERMKKNEEK